MKQISVSEASEQLTQLLEAAVNGEQILIVLDEEHTVQLTPLPPKTQERKPGSAAGEILYMAEDFDAPLEDFEANTQ